ncbi:metallo-beta-lactamase family protein [Nonlabens ulvanivorans]|uniref:Metallo-beta-lactamase family protein n=1 Tax=Nonlabens ulvanivorans TaxID=906888 RepID=A0A090QCA0_NONUL|nr:metallo-beta-lactamase family protein [Nonlabens ulvanivorans]
MVGSLIADVKQPLLLITTKGREKETLTRLSRVGFDQTIGYLKGGFEAWKQAAMEYDKVTSITVKQFEEEQNERHLPVFDVRKESEFLSEHVVDAHNTPLDYINDHLASFPGNTFFIHCAGGYRSMIAASILKSRGIHNLINVEGGFNAIKETDIEVTNYVCPSTL